MSEQYVSLSEQKRLRNKSVKKHAIANILTHWFNVAMWALLLPTGLAILASPRLGIAPELWQTALRNLFGGTANLIKFHYSVGLLWMFVLTYNILIGFRKYFIPFTVQRMAMDKDDVNWLMMKGLQIIGKSVTLPPQDAYNAGQKAYAYVVVLGSFFIGLTGVIMTFSKYIPVEMRWIVQWSLPIHFVSVGAIVAGLFIHVYMGAVFPEEREAFFSMFSGKVSAWYARMHHYKW
ncbi:MAG: cytochrome b/b6 domain-containing protein, partial [Chloroflexi bacterium]|nr:cytochrome b/b6 domain-containing protein [Chloroflexota bacterium]